MILNLEQLRRDYKRCYKQQWAVAKKLELLMAVTKLETNYKGRYPSLGKKPKLSELLHEAGKSLRTIQRWKRAYRRHGIQGLSPKDRGRPPKKILPQEVRNLIEHYRQNYRWGSEVLQAHLLLDHGHRVGRYRIDRYLADSGLRAKYPCTTMKKVKAKKKKHTKKVFVHTPGEHTQMDVKYQLYLIPNGTKAYIYNFIDHASNWSYKKAYQNINAKNTEDFINRVVEKCPFKIKRLQTDNGIEFTFKWASKHPDDPKEHPLFKFCFKESIDHKLIPPGEKELQGLVERSHRQDDQELFSRVSPESMESLNCHLQDYCNWRNERRRFKKLNWLPPVELLKLRGIQICSAQQTHVA